MNTLSTPALVLHTTAYSESSVIAKLFTRQLGVRSYILKGVRKGGSRTKQNLLQPLNHLDLVVYNNPKKQINYLKEIGPHLSPQGHGYAPADGSTQQMLHNAMRFFMTELLYKTLREEEPMPELFDYVVSTLRTDEAYSHLPITFLLSVSRHLGIEPLDNYSLREPLFDLQAGRFRHGGEATLDAGSSQLLHYYLQTLHTDAPTPLASLPQRTHLIDSMLHYYQLHLSDFHSFQSHEILHSVLQ